MSAPVVTVQNLVKWYGPRLAVRDYLSQWLKAKSLVCSGPMVQERAPLFES